MSGWSEQELDRVGQATELQVSSQRTDGSLRPYVTIWVVRAGDDLYIRSAHGTTNPWFRRATASGRGRIRADGLERNVVFHAPDQDVHGAIDRAYHDKYDRYGPRIVGSVVGLAAAPGTLRLAPDSAEKE